MNSWLVYLLEDNEDDAYLVQEYLANIQSKRRFRVKVFNSILSLKQTLGSVRPDALLLDLNLPESLGLNTLVTVKQFAQDVPIIVLTGNAEEHFGEKAIQLGAQDYLPKGDINGPLLSRTIVISKERFELHKNLEQLVKLDRLTMLYNRGAFDEQIQLAIREAQRHQLRFALLFIDLDKFKPVNDLYGHQAGDQLLKLIGAKLKMNNRASDYIARYGGDEFVIIAKHINSVDELEQLTRIKYEQLADTYCVEDLSGKIVEIQLELSIGGVLYPEDGISEETLLSQADQTMYEAKTNGLGFKVAG
ncbi:GGDEF domain-containing response regulator [Pseudoalteromonas xiamenensis]|uniref:GGDEF domain-containing response regulator n=1 Tax=Pseudoalteromonas xiamenensis TaxID=882626 RepID=UPI0027E4C269|nr:GGDEF domain-containing response regulator [Pseudoalteromonas xiamenensis]WMN61164.1 GGDEF domain-containing response regulator [Pseudoalteromonas xiamenensis]